MATRRHSQIFVCLTRSAMSRWKWLRWALLASGPSTVLNRLQAERWAARRKSVLPSGDTAGATEAGGLGPPSRLGDNPKEDIDPLEVPGISKVIPGMPIAMPGRRSSGTIVAAEAVAGGFGAAALLRS